MKVVDSLFLVHLLKGQKNAAQKAVELDSEGGAAITVVSVFEAFFGVSRLRDPARRLEELRRLLGNLEVLPLSVEASLEASEISRVYVEAGRWINPLDALVAGIAVSCGVETLVTWYPQIFDLVPGLKVERY